MSIVVIMARTNTRLSIAIILACLSFLACKEKTTVNYFYNLHETVSVDNWQFDLIVEEQKLKSGEPVKNGDRYLKATLYLSNSKTKKSLLYSISEDQEDYEAKYKYLSFNSKDDLFIKFKNEYIYPIGYVFEPSNGLSTTERLVFKYRISNNMFEQMSNENQYVEYWYIDRFVGLGKICFTHNN